MSNSLESLAEQLQAHFGERLQSCVVACHEVTIEVAPADLLDVCVELRDTEGLGFEQLTDLCGVDYAAYGQAEWETSAASQHGFSRGVARDNPNQAFAAEASPTAQRPRFAAVYHLLSVCNNQRLRVRCFAENDDFPKVDSVVGIWSSANWYEREAFDLYGIIFEGHPDLRRILTDYGFIGHPFRKDFPLLGHVEMRYDPEQKRVIYQPVSVEPRTLVPRVIRNDGRYVAEAVETEQQDEAQSDV